MPWGIEILTSNTFKNPIERIEILHAYPQFQLWATSSGVQNTTWYAFPESDKVVDIFDAAGIKKPDISILSEEFLL